MDIKVDTSAQAGPLLGKSGTCHKCAASLARQSQNASKHCGNCGIHYHTGDCGYRYAAVGLGQKGELEKCPKCANLCLCSGGPILCHAGYIRVKRQKTAGLGGGEEAGMPESMVPKTSATVIQQMLQTIQKLQAENHSLKKAMATPAPTPAQFHHPRPEQRRSIDLTNLPPSLMDESEEDEAEHWSCPLPMLLGDEMSQDVQENSHMHRKTSLSLSGAPRPRISRRPPLLWKWDATKGMWVPSKDREAGEGCGWVWFGPSAPEQQSNSNVMQGTRQYPSIHPHGEHVSDPSVHHRSHATRSEHFSAPLHAHIPHPYPHHSLHPPARGGSAPHPSHSRDPGSLHVGMLQVPSASQGTPGHIGFGTHPVNVAGLADSAEHCRMGHAANRQPLGPERGPNADIFLSERELFNNMNMMWGHQQQLDQRPACSSAQALDQNSVSVMMPGNTGSGVKVPVFESLNVVPGLYRVSSGFKGAQANAQSLKLMRLSIHKLVAQVVEIIHRFAFVFWRLYSHNPLLLLLTSLVTLLAEAAVLLLASRGVKTKNRPGVLGMQGIGWLHLYHWGSLVVFQLSLVKMVGVISDSVQLIQQQGDDSEDLPRKKVVAMWIFLISFGCIDLVVMALQLSALLSNHRLMKDEECCSTELDSLRDMEASAAAEEAQESMERWSNRHRARQLALTGSL